MPDQILFRPVQSARASTKIVAQLRGLIMTQHLRPGDRLPPERDLACIMGVGRSTIREAMRTLESLGMVETRPGCGTFLSAGYQALIEARRILEPQIAALAAERATPEDVAALRRVLDTQAKRLAAGETGSEMDFAFHAAICQTVRNPVLCRLQEILEGGLGASPQAAHAMPGRSVASFEEHQGVLMAIETHDTDLAERRMSAHLEGARQALAPVDRRPPLPIGSA